ncbi:hypothetical protein [Chryseolinea lacunae]|uniref:Lipoprotein n=1 Tax=Chryseolinea lacunae TaxID=2801331 RepID=A0ABS1KY33_9BACT|nr:hypothetical protein [Chryseolinea lacunae]MBL0744355.1 hypothetical protein [Chryseolinea lacunae]
MKNTKRIYTGLSSLVLVLLLTACSLKAQKESDIRQIEFTKTGRGYQENVRVTADSVISKIEDFRAEEKSKRTGRKLAPKEWETLLKTLAGVELKEVPTLPPPTDRRAYDGALAASLQITTTQNQTFGHSFDNEEPHAKLVPLMKAVRALTASK